MIKEYAFLHRQAKEQTLKRKRIGANCVYLYRKRVYRFFKQHRTEKAAPELAPKNPRYK